MKTRMLLACIVALLGEACGVESAQPTGGSGGGPPANSGFASGAGGQGLPVELFSDPVIVASPPAPPVSGGTLLPLRDAHTVVVSDPDRDQLLIVDFDTLTVSASIALSPGDQPGRLAEDGAGRVHVVLRGTGALATIDPIDGVVTLRRDVCREARGVAYDPASDSMLVACAEGVLVTLPAAGGPATRVLDVARDLRDVVVESDQIWLSRFRSAELLRVDPLGQIAERIELPRYVPGTAAAARGAPTFDPEVAWRMIAAKDGGILVVHQLAQGVDLVPDRGGYAGGDGPGGIVEATVSQVKSGEPPRSLAGGVRSVLPVDLAQRYDGALFVASARTLPTTSARERSPAISMVYGSQVFFTEAPTSGGPELGVFPAGMPVPAGEVVAVAIAGTHLLAQTREPSALIVDSHSVALPGDSRQDTGHVLFHLETQAGLACASCHPEGHEDGHVWRFEGLGPRRTQAIQGGVLSTAPFHWDGALQDFQSLVEDVMQGRMLGPVLSDAHVRALADWVDRIPALRQPPPSDAEAVARGQALFSSPALACGTCHSGARFTDDLSADVGTGGPFQVPALSGVFWRAPFMHDGCAATLADRFGPCGGVHHGGAVALEPAAVSDLVSYLDTL